MPRRGNREGSIYKRADGRWEGKIMLGHRQDGKPLRRTVYGKTRQEVAEKLAKLSASAADGALPVGGALKVGDYLAQWFEQHKAFGGRDGGPLRPNTVRDYSTQLQLHIVPAIGDIRLDKLTPQHLQSLYRRILEKGLSRRRAQMAHRLLHVALDAAVRQGLIVRNPADMVVDPPRAETCGPAPVLTQEQARAMLEAVKGTPAYIPFLLAFATGMRRGEVLGLRWSDVDLTTAQIHVRGQWQRDGYEELLKTSSSYRAIPISAPIVEVLRQHKAAQKVVALAGWVCPGRFMDRPYSPQNLDHTFARVRDKLGLDKRLTFHSIRKTFATWLAAAGVDPKTAARLLGHSNVRTTLEIYQEVTADMTRDAIAKVGVVL